MIPAFRFLLISVLLFASVFASAQSGNKVYVTKTGTKCHRSTCGYTQTGDQYLQVCHFASFLSMWKPVPKDFGKGWGEVF
jgi:hypothetical protein